MTNILTLVDGGATDIIGPDAPAADMIDIRAINAHPDNWHTHPDKQADALKRSLDEFGIIAPCTWNVQTGRLLDGHLRLDVARERGQTHLYCRVVNWDERTEKRYLLACDRITSLAGIDADMLANLLAQFQDDPDGLPPGWDTEDVTTPLDIITQAEEAELAAMQADMPQEPDVQSVPSRSKSGDVYNVGGHIVMCADSFDPESIDIALNQSGNMAIDLMFTDPPYQGNFGKFVFPDKDGTKKARKFTDQVTSRGMDKFDPDVSFLPLLHRWFGWQDKLPLHGDQFSIFVFCNDVLQLPYMRWCDEANGSWATLVWEKQQPPPKGGSHWIDCEYLLWMHSAGSTWNDSKDVPDAIRKKVLHHDRGDIDENQKDDGNPAWKPLDLIVNQILLTTKPGDVVCDPFCGTGTTGVACEATSRQSILMDKDPASIDCTLAWLEAATGVSAELLANIHDEKETVTVNE